MRRPIPIEPMPNTSKSRPPLRIATRKSRLAMAQARLIAAELRVALECDAELVAVTSTGDREAHRPLREIGGKGVFVKELEVALLEGRADLAVHSLKDVPSRLADEFALAAIGWREDARDALVSNPPVTFDALPSDARIGTSSLRRKLLLEKLRPDIDIVPMRGNVDTRLSQLDAGAYQGLVLSAAGLDRLGLLHRAVEVFSTDRLLPAPGQGMLGIEVLAERKDIASAVARRVPQEILMIGRIERRVSELLDGDCRLPIATHVHRHHHEVRLRAWIASMCGKLEAHVDIIGDLDLSLADRAVDALLSKDGAEVMATFRDSA